MAIESVDSEHQADTPADQEEEDEGSLPEHRSVWLRLSTDAFATTEGIAFRGEEPAPHIAAYKISASRRAGMILVSNFFLAML
jgi:hypothetical protein